MRVRLEDVCEKESSKLKQSDVIDQNGLYPVYGASGYLGSINTYQQSNYYVAVVKDGAGIGRTMLLPPKSSIIGTMQYLIPKDNVQPEYLYYVVKAKHLEKYFSGATIPHIYFKDYKNEQFDLVSFEKQRDIINRLKKIEIIIDSLSKILVLLDELVRARFVEMFGTIYDKKFDMKTLPDIVSSDKNSIKRGPFGGALKKEDFLEDGYMVYEQRHAIHEDFKYAKYYVSPEKYESMIGFKVVPGDLIISCSGTLGRIAEVPMGAKEGIINQALLKISLNKDIMNNQFFIYQFRCKEIQDMLFGISRGSGIANMPSMNEVKAFKFICPPLELQNQFASFVKEIDKSRSRIQKSLEASQELFDSLMQEYFG